MRDDLYMASPRRIIVTGSREWRDVEAVRDALAKTLERFDCRADQIVIVNGMARGLDTIARTVAIEFEMRVEDHPVTDADWRRWGKSAGHRRNAAMVASGALGCIAFPLGESRGTRGCMALCEAAGIPVWNRGGRDNKGPRLEQAPLTVGDGLGRGRKAPSWARRPRLALEKKGSR